MTFVPRDCSRAASGLDPAADLTPLEGHRHLRSLALTAAAPTGAAPPRTVPHLCGLDLSRAAVRDLLRLAEPPEPRYLSLTGSQWALLLRTGTVPAGLAAARLADERASLDQALAWARLLGPDVGEPFRTTGVLPTADG